MSGECVGAGDVGVLITPVDPGVEPQLPELCETTFGAAPLPDAVICVLRTQTPLPESVETNE